LLRAIGRGNSSLRQTATSLDRCSTPSAITSVTS
jgi:hypothetical protein